MSNEVAVRDVDSWAPMLPAVGDLANKVAGTNFVPKSLRGKPAEVAACILAGREIGIGPMESLQKIYVVDGRPTMSAELMRSLVLRSGHEMHYSVLTDERVTVDGRRKGSDKWTSVSWTMKDAQRVGLSNKDTWKKHPRQMLAARATSELCRLLFPDALGGISYTPEEIEDIYAPAPEAPVTVKRRQAKPVETVDTETGEITEAEIVDDVPAQEPDRMNDGQSKMMGALMKQEGLTDREEALLYCTEVVGREIHTRADLTKAEADKVIASLIQDQADRARAAKDADE